MVQTEVEITCALSACDFCMSKIAVLSAGQSRPSTAASHMRTAAKKGHGAAGRAYYIFWACGL